MARLRSSWGSVTRLGPGRYRLRWPEREGRRTVRRSKVMRCTRREADAELARLRTLREHAPGEAPCPTFRQCWEEWYHPELSRRVGEGSLRPQTRRLYEGLWRVNVGPRWGDVPMDSALPSEWQEWLLTMPHDTARLSNVLGGNLAKCARMHDVRGIEYAGMAYRLRRKERSATDATWTLEELGEVCHAVTGTACEVPAILMAFGGCRVGEACAPLVSDLRMVESHGMRLAVVAIDKQLAQGRRIAPPKTEGSVRSVVIPEPWSLRLEELARERVALGLPSLNDGGDGRPASRTTVSDQWARALDAAGVRRLPMGKLRNSWETMMRWRLGVDKDKIDKMMGHTSADVRSKHYDRPDEEVFVETVAGAWQGFRSVPSGTS